MSSGNTLGTPFVRNALWLYIDGHHHTFLVAGCPVPPFFNEFTGYNKPEASKHRKRSAVNMDAKSLRLHATALREFLVSSWIKQDKWKEMCGNFKFSFDKYISNLAHKRQKTLGSESSGVTLTDSIHVKVLNSVSSVPSQLNDLLDELSTKLNYEYVLVQDFTPTKRLNRFYYICQLEKGIPFPAVLCQRECWEQSLYMENT